MVLGVAVGERVPLLLGDAQGGSYDTHHKGRRRRRRRGQRHPTSEIEVVDSDVFDGHEEKEDADWGEEEEEDEWEDEKFIPSWVRYSYSRQNLTLIMSYFSIGCALQLTTIPVTMYMIDELGVSASQFTIYTILTNLPWTFKSPIGLLSDCCPIRGQRRRPYFVIGWSMHICCYLLLALMGRPSARMVTGLAFISATGYLMADVMTDAMIVERTKLETRQARGTLQATGYIARYFGSFVASAVGAIFYNKANWGFGMTISQFFALNALLPLVCIGPFFPFLVELYGSNGGISSGKNMLQNQLHEIWVLVCKRAVWQPMAFIYIYNALMVPNAAWLNFLIEGLGFTDFAVGCMSIAGAACAWLGLVTYKRFFMAANWRSVYVSTTVLNVIVSLLQVSLILGWNAFLHIPDAVFAAGDDAAAQFIMALQFLPVVTMYAVLCPPHIAGTAYALLTTLGNVASTVSYVFGEMLTGVWDVSNESLAAGQWSGLLKLSILTSCVQLAPIVLIALLPASKSEQEVMQRSNESSSLGGMAFLTVTIASILFSLGQALWELFR